ncbi:conserved hypothetical protein [Altererythrobacter sp. B11]|uniref:hypothetical protein n=1 Tax=Altererythrobacter sp. B11 TaxID=2060312 RepID=UPI000DC7034D|nr:hypothetical protein [Altererythrobacter sp. B11]BBC73026.1 conserved hypothetical protein [Altererythrobacter sp. B11]
MSEVEGILRERLARDGAVLAGVAPVLRHLLRGDAGELFADEVVARVRGMLADLAEQLLLALAVHADVPDRDAFLAAQSDHLIDRMAADGGLLGHVHGLALEGRLTEQLQQRSGIDGVLTPLVQDLAASPEPEISARAMAFLASQARFVQQQRRMDLPLGELPGDYFHRALCALAAHAEAADCGGAAEPACAALRETFEEARSRLGLAARILLGLGEDIAPALQVEQAGVALFTTALALVTEQERTMVLLSFGQAASDRLAVALRTAGLDRDGLHTQLFFIKPDADVVRGLDLIDGDTASALLREESGA